MDYNKTMELPFMIYKTIILQELVHTDFETNVKNSSDNNANIP